MIAGSKAVAVSIVLSILLLQGCISDQGTFNNVNISGYVRAEPDSTAIPGALLMVGYQSTKNTTDSTGYYEYHRTFPTGQGDPLELVVTVTDIDGEVNGVFVSQDTLIYEENTESQLNLYYEIDFYVEIVADSF
ncbi:MAG: hypothetical protein ABFR50_10055 [Candidatus Fermentibacteria bacterium]